MPIITISRAIISCDICNESLHELDVTPSYLLLYQSKGTNDDLPLRDRTTVSVQLKIKHPEYDNGAICKKCFAKLIKEAIRSYDE